jgi:hypothetical protein
MRRTIVSHALVAALVLSAGCYNYDTIRREEISADRIRRLTVEADQCDIGVFTDTSHYQFDRGNYRVQGDTLAGFGVQTAGGYEVPFKGFIPFSAITMIKTEEFSLAKTILIVAIPGAAIGAFFIAWGASAAHH